MIMNNLKTKHYISPEMEMLEMEIEQAVLQNSPGTIEELGDILDEIIW